MTPWIVAFMTVGLAAFVAGFMVRPIFASGKSSSPPVNSLTKEDIAMAVYAELQQPLADLSTAVSEVAAKVAAAVAVGDPAAAQDKSDTIAAVTSAAAAAVTAINAIGQPA